MVFQMSLWDIARGLVIFQWISRVGSTMIVRFMTNDARSQNKTTNAATIAEDALWMSRALVLAKKAAEKGEVPVGALIVKDGKLISMAGNRREAWKTSLGHAELIAIQRASAKLGAWRLSGCTLYVTLEPCVMCAGSLVQSRITRVVYGTSDPKGGAMGSLFQIGQDPRLNHQIEIVGDILREECSEILKTFFKQRR